MNWFYVGASVVLYSIAVIWLTIEDEGEKNRITNLEQHIAKLGQQIADRGGFDSDTARQRFNADTVRQWAGQIPVVEAYRKISFTRLRLLIGSHLAFVFLIISAILQLDTLPLFSVVTIFVSCVLAGLAVPYLLLRREN